MIHAAQLISLIDLTSLNTQDTDEAILKLCQQARAAQPPVAAVCVYSQFITLAKTALQGTPIKTATVANFPAGLGKIQIVAKEIEQSLVQNVDEIDVVIPYQDCLAGNYQTSLQLVKTARQLCANQVLKVIIESGELNDAKLIYEISCRILETGADFIKTSTGKTTTGATLEAATAMLRAIKTVNPQAGFKASGGIRTPEQAQAYLTLVRDQLSNTWCTPQHLRLGASSLLESLLGCVNNSLGSNTMA